jgi:Sec-independent protein translocase protein TatA
MGSLGLPEILVLLVFVVFILGLNRIPRLGAGLGDGIERTKGRRPILVAGRVDADDRFRTEDWEDRIGSAKEERTRRKGLQTLLAVLAAAALVLIVMVAAVIPSRGGSPI